MSSRANTFLSSKGSPTVLPKEVIRATEEEKEYQISMLDSLHQARAEQSAAAFKKLSTVKEENGHPNAKSMIKRLVADQAAIIETAKAVIKAAEKDGDQVSADLATRRMDVHAKNAWMLRSHLE